MSAPDPPTATARRLARVAAALGALAAELRANGERNFVELIDEMHAQAAAPVVDEAEGAERLERLASRYRAMRAHPYGIESVFFGHDTPEETIAATRHLEELRDAVSEAMRVGPDDSVAAPS